MEIRWQDIAKKIGLNEKERNTVHRYYDAIESAVGYDCYILIKGLGKLKSTDASKRREKAKKNYSFNVVRRRYREKVMKRNQRAWAFEEFDQHWTD